MAAVERQPFGELSNGRLQQLASAKNRLNGLISTKEVVKPIACIPTPTKRSYAMSMLGDDSENVDPIHTQANPKKNKFGLSETPAKPVLFATAGTPMFTAPSTRTHGSGSIKTLLSAPAGRSPKRKALGLAPSRRSFTSYARVDPPFASRGVPTGLPFSLDAALSSTFGPAKPSTKPVPTKWKFEIYEDTPDEEAGTLMEHSTLTLDLSSDDEDSLSKKTDRGKENVAPEGYDARGASRAAATSSQAGARSAHGVIVKKKVETDEMDDDQRVPLSELEIELLTSSEADKPASVVIHPEETSESTKMKPGAHFTFTVVPPVASKSTDIEQKDICHDQNQEEIVVFEDSSNAAV